MNEHRTHTASRPIRLGSGRGAVVAIAALAFAGSAEPTQASAPTAPRPASQVSYQAFRGSADTLEHWVDAALTNCIEDARPTDFQHTADAIDRQLSNTRETCTAQIVTPDRK